MLGVTFTIDPSVNNVENEHLALAEYLKERYLNVDIYDSDSHFLYGTCKVPLYELLRQQRTNVVRSKECDASAPDSADIRGTFAIVMQNKGANEKISLTQDPRFSTQAPPTLEEKLRARAGHQPSQNQHGFRKVVRSKPMDLTQENRATRPQEEAAELGRTTKSMQGGRALESTYREMNVSLDTLNQQQVSAANMNQDLRKKLRVDRVKKMTLGTASTNAPIEDPNQPEWMKHRSLKTIEMIRENKKDDILNQVFGVERDGSTGVFSVTPGQLKFLPIPIVNNSKAVMTFEVVFDDPDIDLLGGKAFSEFRLVNNDAEIRHWVSLDKVKRPPVWQNISTNNVVWLQPGQSMELLVKFLTKREVSFSKKVLPSKLVIKPRRVRILIHKSDKSLEQAIDLNVVPTLAPVDHTFRFYEPESSAYQVVVPPFILLN